MQDFLALARATARRFQQNQRTKQFNRRTFLQGTAAGAVALSLPFWRPGELHAQTAAHVDLTAALTTGNPETFALAAPISSAAIGQPIRYNDQYPASYCMGDTFMTAWGNDGTLYMTMADTSGFNGGANSNTMLTSMSGSPNNPSTFRGTNINAMNGNPAGSINLGVSVERGSDGNTWKPTGLASYGGVLYMAISREGDSNGQVPWAVNVSIIKSTDGGANWTNHLGQTNTPPPIDAAGCMFPGSRLGNLSFVQFGQDGAPPSPAIDNSDEYVYAWSQDTNYNLQTAAGNDLYLARCLISNLPHLDKTTWQFFSGGISGDGMQDSNWTSDLSTATPFYSREGVLQNGDLLYIEPLGRYLLATDQGWPGVASNARYWIYEAPHPWGPWTQIYYTQFIQTTNQLPTFAQPTMPNKFVSSDGRNLWIFASNDFTTGGESPDQTVYCLWTFPLTLYPGPALVLDDDVTGSGINQISYNGSWGIGASIDLYQGSCHYSNTANDTAIISFRGSQIRYCAALADDQGQVAVSLDGGTETIINLQKARRVTQEIVWSSDVLPTDNHILNLRVIGNGYVTVDRLDIIPPITIIDDSVTGSGQNQLNYTGPWGIGVSSDLYNGQCHYCYDGGSTVTLTFNGTQVYYYAALATDQGQAAVSIDGGEAVIVDLYAPGRRTQAVTWASPVLSPGTHTLQIQATGNKNVRSTGAVVTVDRIDVIG